MKTKLTWILGALAVIFVALQFTNPARTNPPVVHDFLAAETPPPPLAAMFRGACYDCHSYETRWPWYSHIAPVSWLIASDVSGWAAAFESFRLAGGRPGTRRQTAVRMPAKNWATRKCRRPNTR